MLDEVIKGVKQRFRRSFQRKKADWPWKNPCATVWKVLTIWRGLIL